MMTLSEAEKKHRQEVDTSFDEAIAQGRLSAYEGQSAPYAGDYMYMGKSADGQRTLFKNQMTREYLK